MVGVDEYPHSRDSFAGIQGLARKWLSWAGLPAAARLGLWFHDAV